MHIDYRDSDLLTEGDYKTRKTNFADGYSILLLHVSLSFPRSDNDENALLRRLLPPLLCRFPRRGSTFHGGDQIPRHLRRRSSDDPL